MSNRTLKTFLRVAAAILVIFGIVCLRAGTGVPVARAQGEKSPYQVEIEKRLDGDSGFTDEERAQWKTALNADFTGAFEGLPADEERVLDWVDTVYHVITEGLFAELGPIQVSPTARAAFGARALGAPAEAVEGIALYGLSEYAQEKGIRFSAEQIAAWAKGADDAKRLGIPSFIAEDFVAQAITGGWSLEDYNKLNKALMQAVVDGFDAEVAGRYLLFSVERGDKSIDKIIKEMKPYLEKVRREEAESGRKRQETLPEDEPPAEEPPARPTDGKKSTASAAPVEGAARQGNKKQTVSPAEAYEQMVRQQMLMYERYKKQMEKQARSQPGQNPMLQFMPPQPSRQNTSQQTASHAPVSNNTQGSSSAPARSSGGLVAAQPNQILGTISRGALRSEVSTWIGTPYQWGGTRKIYGADCSGFTQGSYRAVGLGLPRVSRDQARLGRFLEAVGTRNVSFGDLVFFDTRGRGERSRVTHVGIYLENGRMIHASSSKGIQETDFSRRYYQSKYMFGRRITQFSR